MATKTKYEEFMHWYNLLLALNPTVAKNERAKSLYTGVGPNGIVSNSQINSMKAAYEKELNIKQQRQIAELRMEWMKITGKDNNSSEYKAIIAREINKTNAGVIALWQQEVGLAKAKNNAPAPVTTEIKQSFSTFKCPVNGDIQVQTSLYSYYANAKVAFQQGKITELEYKIAIKDLNNLNRYMQYEYDAIKDPKKATADEKKKYEANMSKWRLQASDLVSKLTGTPQTSATNNDPTLGGTNPMYNGAAYIEAYNSSPYTTGTLGGYSPPPPTPTSTEPTTPPPSYPRPNTLATEAYGGNFGGSQYVTIDSSISGAVPLSEFAPSVNAPSWMPRKNSNQVADVAVAPRDTLVTEDKLAQVKTVEIADTLMAELTQQEPRRFTETTMDLRFNKLRGAELRQVKGTGIVEYWDPVTKKMIVASKSGFDQIPNSPTKYMNNGAMETVKRIDWPTYPSSPERKQQLLNENKLLIQNGMDYPQPDKAADRTFMIPAKYDYRIIVGDTRFKSTVHKDLEENLRKARAALGIPVHGSADMAKTMRYFLYN